MRRHLGPLLGPDAGLALVDEVAHQSEPPRPEHDDGGRDDQCGAGDRAQRRHRPVSLDKERNAEPAQ